MGTMAELSVIGFSASVSFVVEWAEFRDSANDFAQRGKGFFGGIHSRGRYLDDRGSVICNGDRRRHPAWVEAARSCHQARSGIGRCGAKRLAFDAKPLNQEPAEPLLPAGRRYSLESVHNDRLQCDACIE